MAAGSGRVAEIEVADLGYAVIAWRKSLNFCTANHCGRMKNGAKACLGPVLLSYAGRLAKRR